MEILAILLLHATSVDVGKLSMYFPGDGSNAGELACGGSFTDDMDHVAHRGWRRLGCGRPVLVCAEGTFSCALTKVRDAGPFGIVKGRSWRVHTGFQPPRGWRWRAAADLSAALYHRLHRPPPLSRIYMVFIPEVALRFAREVELAIQRWLTPLRHLAIG